MKGRASRGVDAMLAAIATLTAAWPVSTLLVEPTWVSRTLLLLVVVVLSGVSARALVLRGWQVLTVQLACVVLATSAIYGQGHLWHGLPTFETLGVADKLIREAIKTAQLYAAPAPTTPGLIFVVSAALALVALAVDYLAVTRRSPSLAGLPLLSAFLASAANTGASLPVHFFLAAATMWLVLVARQGSAVLRRWGTTVTLARTPVRGTDRLRGAVPLFSNRADPGRGGSGGRDRHAGPAPPASPEVLPLRSWPQLVRHRHRNPNRRRRVLAEHRPGRGPQRTKHGPGPSVHDRRLVAAAATSRGHVFLPIPARRMATLR